MTRAARADWDGWGSSRRALPTATLTRRPRRLVRTTASWAKTLVSRFHWASYLASCFETPLSIAPSQLL